MHDVYELWGSVYKKWKHCGEKNSFPKTLTLIPPSSTNYSQISTTISTRFPNHKMLYIAILPRLSPVFLPPIITYY